MARMHRLHHRGPDAHRLESWSTEITLRLATGADAAAVERLAQRDSRRLEAGSHLVALRNGRIAAALSLATGELIADPFQRTAELCALLRCHADGARVAGQHTVREAAAEPRPVAALA